ncbi:MAG: transporter [Bacteroidales bacterium]|nr:transporter [Bacteroidales bacterium]
MKKLFIAAILAVCCFSVKAQEDVGFTADRPGASTGPSVVGRGVIQLEQGIQYDGDGGVGTITFSNTLLRYGLFPNMELRLGGDGFLYKEDGSTQGFKPAFSGLSVGTKIKCFEGQGAIPAVSVLADFAVPYTSSKGFNTDHLAPSLYLLFENPINDWLSVGYNLGAEWDGTLPNATTFAAVCLGFSATESLGCFIESYNYFGALGNIYAMDFGFNWMIGRKVQFDLAANMDLRSPAQCWSISCGVAWQINK